MRMIGQLASETEARTFADYLYVKGIKSEVELETDGKWVVWILGEDDVEEALSQLKKFSANPMNPEFGTVATQADEMRLQERKNDEVAAKRFFNRSQVFRDRGAYGLGRLTGVLIGMCVAVWAAREFGGNKDFWNFLFISNYMRGLPEVRNGEIWRLITPIFMHAPMPMVLHLLFNLLWLKDLGSMVEARQSWLRLFLLVICISVPSNLAQYFNTGPAFCGMSGVVYGLLGYIWMKGKFEPTSGYFVHPTTVAMMMIWFVLGFTGMLNIANSVHAVGLAIGLAWGYLSAMRSSAGRS